jgi:hypothetical protein
MHIQPTTQFCPIQDQITKYPSIVRYTTLNTSMKTHRLPKGMVLGHALSHPTSMVALIADTDVVDVP